MALVAVALLKAGATVDVPGGPDLDTPLHDAIQNCQQGCCEILLNHGADPLLPNGAGFTPLQLVDMSISKLNEPKGKSKSTLRSSQSNVTNTVRNTLLIIRDTLMASISKRCPPVVNNAIKINESVTSTSNDMCKRLSIIEASNPALSISFKERRRLRPVLLATGLNRTQQVTFGRVATMIRAQVVSNISPEVTHVITGAMTEISPSPHATSKKTSKRSASAPSNDRNLEKPSTSESSYQVSCPRTLKFLNAVLQVSHIFKKSVKILTL
ncbi:unnamed protein product [Echinostoma caproni]|uniref:ANK_REP_REGION domain-containing protein n=1 Tax=Echinostoma caproni TaxID=27848 RepID=A0A183B394_9TREM|nr:unnamed protein product [Echinostoma caproni]